MGEKLPRILPKWWLPRHFWVLLHALNLQHGTDGFTSPLKEGVLRNFSPEKSVGFSQVWTHELGYQRLARLPLDHRSRSYGIKWLKYWCTLRYRHCQVLQVLNGILDKPCCSFSFRLICGYFLFQFSAVHWKKIWWVTLQGISEDCWFHSAQWVDMPVAIQRNNGRWCNDVLLCVTPCYFYRQVPVM